MPKLFDAEGRAVTISRDKSLLAQATKELLAEARPGQVRELRNVLKARRKAQERQETKARLQARVDMPVPMVTVAREQGVYVVGTIGGPIKIGIAQDVTLRVKGLQSSHPEKLRVYHFTGTLRPGRARVIERECHKRLDQHRLSGEWFDVEWRDAVDLVRSLAA